jgi:hypothetical protein
MRPIVRCYDVDPTLPYPRQLAVEHAYGSLHTAARIANDDRRAWLARDYATKCRELVATFGVRRPVRSVVSVAVQQRIRAEIDARVEARRAAENAPTLASSSAFSGIR